MQDEPQTITIKLKPNLQEYLKFKMKDDIFIASKLSFIGSLIRPFLSRRPANVPPFIREGPEYITIQIPSFEDLEIRRGTIWMSETNQRHFESILDKHFKDLFFNYVDDKIRYMKKEHTSKGSVKYAILQFCSDYNISFDSTTYEMLQKSYYRKKKFKKPGFFAKDLSAMCPMLFLI